MADGIHHQCHTGFERDVEAGHAHIGNGELGSSAVALIDKEGNHGTAGAHHIAIANHGEADVLGTADVVGSSKELVRCELGGAVKVDRGTSLVGGECHYVLNTGSKGGFNHVLRTVHIGFNAFFRIVFSGIYLLDGSCMDNHIHSFASTRQAFEVANITDEVAHLRIVFLRILLLQLELFQLIARVNNDFLYLRIITKYGFHKLLAEGTCSSGNQYGFVIKHYSVTCLFIYVFPWIGIVYHVLKFSNGFLLLGSE